MLPTSERQLETGGDPRTLNDYALLREEMQKLCHPARPDINWRYAEMLCLQLFEHNGVELQTAAWYTLTRTHLAGLHGLTEGLAVLEALVSRQWGCMWPPQVHARIDILRGLSQRVQQHLRSMTFIPTDLVHLYRAETLLSAMGIALQRVELKYQAGTDALSQQIRETALRLENQDGSAEGALPRVALNATAGLYPALDVTAHWADKERKQWVFVTTDTPQPQVKVVTSTPGRPWAWFGAGMLTMVLFGSALWWGYMTWQPTLAYDRLMATVAPWPKLLPETELQALHQHNPTWLLNNTEWPAQVQQRLVGLAAMSATQPLDYGIALVDQLQRLQPDLPETTSIAHRWWQALEAAAMPTEDLSGWHQGVVQLKLLADKLNSLDEQKGKYMTVSELKSSVFLVLQLLNRTVPLEEHLRELAAVPVEQPLPPAQQAQTALRLKQLLVRYALITQRAGH